jgi:uncharacterized protein (TIGR02265 family)
MDRTPPEPLDTLTALEARLRRCTPTDQIAGGPILGFLRAAQASFDPKAAEVVLAALPERDRYQASFRYPVADLLSAVLAWGRHEAVRGRPFAVHLDEGALREGFLTSPLGKTVASLSHADPHRFLAQSHGALRATTTFGSHRYARLGEQRARLEAEGDLLGPAWLAELVIGAIRGVCHREAQVQLVSTDADRVQFAIEVSWA